MCNTRSGPYRRHSHLPLIRLSVLRKISRSLDDWLGLYLRLKRSNLQLRNEGEMGAKNGGSSL